ncbi:MAG: YHS domain protein [Cyclobacteriaceae bacterium]|nr:YHS domain protein [Cyclobacteriaceae bacterium]
MKTTIATIILIVLAHSFSYAQAEASRTKHYNTKKSLAIDGYDPVSYFSNKAEEGKESITYNYKGVTYQFANTTNLNKFKSNPDHYEPSYGGWCAYAMGESGEKVKVDPETFKVVDGKLYLFYNFWGNNTLTDWNKDEKALKTKADQNWKKIVQ